MPDPERFTEVIGGVVAQAGASAKHVRIFGEMVALLADEGNHAATVALEGLWNDLRKQQRFTLFCAYPMDHLGGATLDELLSDVCASHSHVIPAESYSSLSTEDERLRAIAALQQKAQSLEAEIEERRRAEDALRRTEEELRDLLQTRDEFLSAAAHDLKNPLASVKAHAQLLRRRVDREGVPDPAHVLQGLASIEASVTKMAALVNELLDAARLQLGEPIDLNLSGVDLVDLASRLAADFQHATERHQIRVEAPIELRGEWDPERLERVLSNLLDNAIKYSPQGGEILLTLGREEEPDGGCAALTIRDQGLGIPAADLPRVFERFHRGANVVGQIRGTGIGLMGARQIVELHGGTIQVESQEGVGTTFTVRLPLPAAVATPGEEATSAAI
jgi:signal transduction histidine kinase